MKDFDIEDRVERATGLFFEGYNCAQSVFLAYADVFDLQMDLAKSLSVSFGGGMARMREVCGTVSAMAMLAGLKYPVPDPKDMEARRRNYGTVQLMAEQFKNKHQTLLCHDLLPAAAAAKNNPAPSERTAEYYKKRPCVRYVADAARIAGQMLKEELVFTSPKSNGVSKEN